MAKAEKDGHTLLLADVGAVAAAPNLFSKLTYDPQKDLTGVGMVMFASYILAVHPSVPVKTVAELVAYAKANPGKLAVGNSGVGNTNHLTGILLAKHWGIDWKYVPYKGGAAAIRAVVANESNVIINSALATQSFVTQNQLKGLAVSGTKRLDALKNLPTFKELNLPAVDSGTWQGVVTHRRHPGPHGGAPERGAEEDPGHARDREEDLRNWAARCGHRLARGLHDLDEEHRLLGGGHPRGGHQAGRVGDREMASRGDRPDIAFGSFLILLAIVALVGTRTLTVGTAANMGPGYVPRALAWIILGFGVAIAAARPAEQHRPAPSHPAAAAHLRARFLAVFALLLPKGGLVLATLGTMACSTFARPTSSGVRACSSPLVLTAFTVLLFVNGLGLPLSVWPQW